MPIDFNAIASTITAIEGKTTAISEVVYLAKEGKTILPGIGNRPFTASEQQALVNAYQTLKSELAALYQTLP